MTVIDVHTHMINSEWLELLSGSGDGRFSLARVKSGQQAIHFHGAPFMTLTPGMLDYDLRIRDMNEAKVDLAIVSLTCPNVYWGDAALSARAARSVNDSMAAAQTAHPDRIRWFASLPWQHPQLALEELKRARAAGAIGVMVLANIAGQSLTDPLFAPIWAAIDAMALPVLCHPGTPPGVEQMDMTRYNLIATVGFCFDTTLAVSRMLYDGFFKRHPNLKFIAAHAGGALPYLSGRLDAWFEKVPDCHEFIDVAPSDLMRSIYFDAVTYRPDALRLCIDVAGDEQVMYGSDYPHNTGDMKGCLARVDSMGEAVSRKIRSSNARRVFGL